MGCAAPASVAVAQCSSDGWRERLPGMGRPVGPPWGVLTEGAASTNGEETSQTLLLRADLDDWRDDKEFRRGKDGLLRGHLVGARHMAGRIDTAVLRGPSRRLL